MSEDDTSNPNNPGVGDDPDGNPAPLGSTEITEDGPSSEADYALSEQAKRVQGSDEPKDD